MLIHDFEFQLQRRHLSVLLGDDEGCQDDKEEGQGGCNCDRKVVGWVAFWRG